MLITKYPMDIPNTHWAALKNGHEGADTKTGLVKYPALHAEMGRFSSMIKAADAWCMRQPPGAKGARLHIHNNWNTYIWYPFDHPSALLVELEEGDVYRYVPMAQGLVHLPEGTRHGVERNDTQFARWSVVFLSKEDKLCLDPGPFQALEIE